MTVRTVTISPDIASSLVRGHCKVVQNHYLAWQHDASIFINHWRPMGVNANHTSLVNIYILVLYTTTQIGTHSQVQDESSHPSLLHCQTGVTHIEKLKLSQEIR